MLIMEHLLFKFGRFENSRKNLNQGVIFRHLKSAKAITAIKSI